jgi:pilus assembly protein Flp/PilA
MGESCCTHQVVCEPAETWWIPSRPFGSFRQRFIIVNDLEPLERVEALSIKSCTPLNTKGPTPMLDLYVSLQNFIAGRKAEIEERGATAVEYALMVGLIAIAIIGSVSLLGDRIKSSFNTIGNTLPG